MSGLAENVGNVSALFAMSVQENSLCRRPQRAYLVNKNICIILFNMLGLLTLAKAYKSE